MTKRRNPDLELVRGHNYCLPDQVGTDHQMTALGGDDTAMAPLIHAPDCDKCAKKQRQRGDGTVKQSVFMEEFREFWAALSPKEREEWVAGVNEIFARHGRKRRFTVKDFGD